jgi:hypothetical protein
VMRDGRVVEQGTHASLWSACGEYRSLAEPWFGGGAGSAPLSPEAPLSPAALGADLQAAGR